MPGGWLRSGDLGYVREDGALVLTGRAKDVYKCGAELVMLADIEACLTLAPRHRAGLRLSRVPDPRMGEVGCAWIVLAEQAKLGAEEVIGYCGAELARFKVPAYVLFITACELPLDGVRQGAKVQAGRACRWRAHAVAVRSSTRPITSRSDSRDSPAGAWSNGSSR